MFYAFGTLHKKNNCLCVKNITQYSGVYQENKLYFHYFIIFKFELCLKIQKVVFK